MGFLKDAREQAKATVESRETMLAPTAPTGIQYRVEQVRETLIGDKITTTGLQDILNLRASEGWIFRQAVEAAVKGRVGPGGTEGLLLIFERQA